MPHTNNKKDNRGKNFGEKRRKEGQPQPDNKNNHRKDGNNNNNNNRGKREVFRGGRRPPSGDSNQKRKQFNERKYILKNANEMRERIEVLDEQLSKKLDKETFKQLRAEKRGLYKQIFIIEKHNQLQRFGKAKKKKDESVTKEKAKQILRELSSSTDKKTNTKLEAELMECQENMNYILNYPWLKTYIPLSQESFTEEEREEMAQIRDKIKGKIAKGDLSSYPIRSLLEKEDIEDPQERGSSFSYSIEEDPFFSVDDDQE
eukprot:TRINITY_DN3155_c0_g1_i1.p1 TRINITY_DN3155_c0_g1~~TRINITY_DN3155_c0_g1_i1.p1  ORF type:complete len:260 (+),score=105.57 TRINITY_DN3155_c0_g1_i1:96-875(+)